jgi:hypothetical protein
MNPKFNMTGIFIRRGEDIQVDKQIGRSLVKRQAETETMEEVMSMAGNH